MSEQLDRVKRNTKLIKGFMLFVVLMQVIQIAQTNTLDLGDIAGAVGVLALLRGIMLSPKLLAAPVDNWLGARNILSKDSQKYFLLSFVLIIVSLF